MPNLRELSLFGFSLFSPMDLSGSPFKLKSLLISPPTDIHIAKFISSQPTIVDLNITSFTLTRQCVNIDHFIDPTMLPDLHTITGCPGLIASLAPGRPLTNVIIRPCHVHDSNKADIIKYIASLDHTTAPIQSLHFDSDDRPEFSGWDFIECLKATGIPLSLVCLTVKANLLDFATQQAKNPSYLTEIAQVLQGFACLQYFEVEEAVQGLIQEQPSAHEVIDMVFAVIERQANLKDLWRQNCPSLTSVKLFDKTIF
ncbi:unnamed protein product [Rhizoctonia solani]|uniref:Uncharacterized protein n=1 Tax=Rhizoctonia solani TaxID=456999 RepID=A0A8H2WPB1_9AGAM|nr:unnamed protein product [Rhizoctonia solani]